MIALIEVLGNINLSLESDKVSVLVLLDLTAAFDANDHIIAIDRLNQLFSFLGMFLYWFQSYFQDRHYFVSISKYTSELLPTMRGVLQLVILEPLVFNLYKLPLAEII